MHVHATVEWWLNETRVPDARGKLEGLAFSILSALDGCVGGLPRFVVSPSPHPNDKQFRIDEGEDYYPEAPQAACDISGCLHELFHQRKTV